MHEEIFNLENPSKCDENRLRVFQCCFKIRKVHLRAFCSENSSKNNSLNFQWMSKWNLKKFSKIIDEKFSLVTNENQHSIKTVNFPYRHGIILNFYGEFYKIGWKNVRKWHSKGEDTNFYAKSLRYNRSLANGSVID